MVKKKDTSLEKMTIEEILALMGPMKGYLVYIPQEFYEALPQPMKNRMVIFYKKK